MRRDLAPGNLGSSLPACRHPTAQVFLRLATANEGNIEPGGDPNLVMHLYGDQSQMRFKPRELRANSTNVSRPISAKSDSVRPGPDPVPPTATGPINSNQQGDSQSSESIAIGIGVRSAELPSTTFARVRVSIGIEHQWTSPYAQVGADGDLGVFRWEVPCVFESIAVDAAVLVEVIARSDRPASGSSPVFEMQSAERIFGWGLLSQLISSDNQLRLGSVDIELFAPPVPSGPSQTSSKILDAVLHVDVFPPDYAPSFQTVSLLVDESLESYAVLPWIDYTRVSIFSRV